MSSSRGGSQPSILSFFKPNGREQQSNLPSPVSTIQPHQRNQQQQQQQQQNAIQTSPSRRTLAPAQAPAPPGPAPVLPRQIAAAQSRAASHLDPQVAALGAAAAAATATAGTAAASTTSSSSSSVPQPLRSSWSTPHPQAHITPIAAEHIHQIQRINSLLLCVSYPDSFYERVLDPNVSGLFSRAIVWSEEAPSRNLQDRQSQQKVIGSLIARLEPSPFQDPAPAASTTAAEGATANITTPKQRPAQALYIQSLTLLSPYRSLGLAHAALESAVDHAILLSSTPETTGLNIADVYAHVWTENEDGLRWYAARGFRAEGEQPVAGYYLKLRPDTAWIVRRGVVPQQQQQQQQQHGRDQVGATPQPAVLLGNGLSDGVAAAAAARLLSREREREQEQERQQGLQPPRAGPPPAPSAASPSALCYQDKRPETDWNDLPAEVVAAAAGAADRNGIGGGRLLAVWGASGDSSGNVSGASSRSSSTARRKKKERGYPAAAFGS